MKRKFIHSGTKMKRRRQAEAGRRGPKALAGSISSFCRVLAVSAITALGLGEAGAVTYYWDAVGGGFLGGGGQWDVGSSPNWWNGTTDVNWTNAGPIDAVFSNISGNVSITSAVQVGNMTFNVDGYSLINGGGGSIDFGTVTRTITVNNTSGLLTPNTAHILAMLKGTNGFIKAGSGILSLEGDSTGSGGLTGHVTIDAGTLLFNFIDGHTSAILLSSNRLTFTNTGQFIFKADSAGNSGAKSMALARLTFQGGEGTMKAEAADDLQRAAITFNNLQRNAGATGNLVQNALPQTSNANGVGGGGFTITVPLSLASSLTEGDSVTGTNIQPNTKIAVGGINTGTGVITLTLATTGSSSTQSLTFGAEQKRIIFTNITINGGPATPAVDGFIDKGIFFNGSSYAWYDTSNFARVRAINYGVDANTATQGASTTGITGGNLNKHLRVTGDISGQGTATLLTLNLSGSLFSGGVALNPGTTLTLTNGGILKSGGGSTTISGGTIKAGPSGTNEMVIRVDGPTEGLTITSILTSNGVTKSGLGSLELNPQTSGALSFSGSTTTNTSNTITLASAAPAALIAYVTSQPANSVPVYGPGIQNGTTISSISGSTVTLSLPATATSAFPLSYSTAVDSALSTITLSPAEAGTLTVGQIVTGASIAPNTTITAINTNTGLVTLNTNPLSSAPLQALTFGGTTVAIGGTQNFNVTTGSLDGRQSTTQITSTTVNLLSAAPVTLVQGMSVSGPGIAPGTTVAGVSGTTVTLSQPAQADSVPLNNSITSQFVNGQATYNITNAQAGTLVSGSAVSGTGIPVGTTFALGAANSGGAGNTQVTLSNLFTAGTGNYTPTYGGALIQFGTSTLTVSPAVAATLLVGSTVSGPATGSQIAPNTVITNIQQFGANYIVTLSNEMSGTQAPEFVTFGGGSVVSINSAYTGATLVNSGTFAVSASGLPAGGLVSVAGGARLAAVSSVITNNITLAGADAILSGSGLSGSSSGFSGTITAGVNDFQLIAKDFTTNADTNLTISGPIVGSGSLTVPSDSNGTVILSGNNVGFTGSVIVGNGAKLSIARLNSLINGNPVDLSGTLILALDGNGGAAYASGGNGTGAPQTLTLTSSVTLTGTGVIQPDRDGTAYGGYFLNARNKTVQINNLTLTGVDLTVQNNNGYGLGVNGITDLGVGLNTITVANATSSNVVQGLTLNGILTGGLTGPGASIFRKLGPGTLVLANSGNNFGGGGSVISIEQGVLAAGSNGAFGNSANVIGLNWSGTGAAATLRATTTFTIPVGRSVQLSSATGNGIEVVGGSTLTLASPFVFPTGLQTNGFTKGENGTLLISADNNSAAVVKTYPTIVNSGDTSVFLNPADAAALSIGWFVRGTNMADGARIIAIDIFTGEVTFDLPTTGAGSQNTTFSGAWAGPLTITAGAVRVLNNGNALGDGTGAVTVTRSGAALQIGGNITVGNRLTIAGTGLNSAGALQSRPTSTNTYSGQIILGTAVPTTAIIGADATSVLNITGGITGTLGSTLTFNSAGNINITTNPFDPAYSFTGDTGLSTLMTNVSDTSNIVIGQGITGLGIPANARVTAKTANTLTLSAAATLVASNTFTAQGSLNIVKTGVGTVTLGVNSPNFIGTLQVNQGTFAISGSGVTIGNPTAAGAMTIQGPSGVLLVDDSVGAPVGDRVPANRNVALIGGMLIYNGNAAGSSESFGTLAVSRSATNVVASNPSGAASVALNFTSLTVNADSNVDFQGSGLGVNGTNRITFTGATGTVTNSIMQRATINGADFVSYNTTGAIANSNGIQAFANYNVSNNIDSAATTNTLDITADPIFTASKTINAFRISGGTTATGSALQGNTVTLSAGAILSTTGTNTVNFPVIRFGVEGFVAVSSGGQLTIGSVLSGTAGFVKALPGTLLLNAPSNSAGYANLSGQTLTGNFVINAGTLKLGGGNNTLTPNQFLIVAPGATLDLNGTSQFAIGTRGDGAALQGNAGTFTNTSTTSQSALIFGADSAAVNFGGVIRQELGAQAMSFFKGSAQTYNFYNANTYSGATVFSGGINELRDGGTLANTSSITLNYARLAFNDDVNFALANRVNASAPISMRGASLSYANGRTQTETTQAVGAVTLFEGQNMIQAVNPGGTSTTVGVNSAVLTLASLARSPGSSATLRFIDNGTLGLIGNSGRVVITAAPTLSQNLIGPWAVVDREFASYIPVLGVGALSTAGFAGYSANFLNRLPNPVSPAENIRATLGIPGLAVDTTVNTLAVNTNVAAVGGVPVPTIIDLGGKKLTLAGGGLILALNGDNQNITVQNGTITSGALNVGGDLYLHALNYGGANRTFTVSAVIADNGTGPVRLVKASGAVDAATDFLTLSGANTYSGGTVINGGNVILASTGVIPAGGLTISGGEIAGIGALIQDAGGVINPLNTVTMNGLGALNLSGNNTVAGLVFNGTGIGSAGIATAAPTVTTFRSVTALGTGTLTLGGGGITSTPLNPAAISTVAGRLDFGAAPSTVTVNAYDFGSFTDFAPTTAGLILQGVIGSSGTITKAGAGVLQLGAQETFTGQLHVTAGTVQIGVTNGGSRFSQLNLDAGTRLNLNNFSTIIGSLAGSGTVTNTLGAQTLTVGFDGSSTTFSGQFSRFNDATPGAVTLIKVGAGTMTIASAQNALSGSSGGVTVNGGGLTYSGVGAAYPSTVLTPVTYNVNTAGTLTLDNSGTNVANRLGLNASNGTLGLGGGTVTLVANAAASSETINLLNFNSGASTIQFTGGAGGTVTLNVTGNVSGQGGQDTALVTGLGLGSTVNVVVTGAFPSTGGGGGAGTDTISIRADLLGDATGGAGTGFLTRDSANRLRPLNQTTELTPDMVLAAITGGNSNTGLTSGNNLTTNRIIANQTINSFTLLGAGTPTLSSGVGLLSGFGTTPASGVFAPTAAPLALTVTSGGILALANAGIGVLNGGVAIISGGVTQDYHVVGAGVTLNLFGSILNSTSGIVKADAGTLILNASQYYTGTIGTNGTTVNGGTLRLNGGNNTVLVQPTGNIPNVYSLFMNGGTLDLNGNNQIVERISNNNTNTGTGGLIINSGGLTVTFSSATATGTTFAGSIGTGVLSGTNNAINFVKSGIGTLVLTSANTYTGTTVLRGGGLTLQDGGTLAQTSSVTVNFGTLLINQAGLNPLGNPNPIRISATTPLTLNGGTFQQNSGGSVDSSVTFNTVTLGSGGSVITQNTLANAGSSALISIGSLVQQIASSTVNFASSSGTLGGGGLNNNQIRITSITPSGGGASSPASLLVNGMLPAWITVNGTDFAGYLPSATAGSQGVGALGSVNFPGYAAPLIPYTTTTMPAAQILANASSAFNVSVAVSMQAVAGRAVNSVAVRNPAANVVALIPINRSTDTLSIGTGGLLLNSGANAGASAVVQGGRITAGETANSPGVLYITSSGTNTQVINSQIVNNGNQTYGVNIDSGIIGTGSSGSLQLGSNVITVASVSGLVVGQPVSGVGIPAGSVITAIASTGTPFPVGAVITRTLSGTVTNTTPIAATAAFTIGTPTTSSSFRINAVLQNSVTTTAGSPTISVLVPSTLVAGMYVSGPGIPGGTVVTSVGTGANTGVVTLSNPVTASMAPRSFFAQVGASVSSFTLPVAQANLLTVGMTVTGGNIRTVTNTPSAVYATYITNIAPEPGNPALSRITLSQTTTTASLSTQLLSFGATLNFARMGNYVAIPVTTGNNSAAVTVNNNTGIVLGTPVSGPGIPAGTVVATIPSATGITLGDTLITTGTGGTPNGVPVTATQSNSGINLTFGNSVTIGDGSSGVVSVVKTGTGTLTLTPQLVMNAAFSNGSTTVAVPTTAGLLAGMTVSGTGIPAGAVISSVNAGTSTITLNSAVTANSAATGNQLTYGPGSANLSLLGVTLATSAWSNTYTGGTTVNQGGLNLAGIAGSTVIPGNLTINGGATVTMVTNAQQIAAASNITINGSGVLNLVGANTLASLTINNTGGNAAPTVALGTSGTLTLTNGLTVTNDSLSFTPTISGTTSTLVLPNSTITVSGASPDGLIIPVLISPAGALVKAGTGSLILSGANVFTTGVNLNAGSIILGASSTPTTNPVTSGPLGTGTLNMANGTALLSDGTLRTIGNLVNIAAGANVTFGPLPGSGAALAGNGVTLAGPVTLNGGAATITVPDLLNLTTISGVLSGGNNLTLNKNGTGILLLSNGANTFTGTTTINVNAGVLRLGATTALPAGIDLTIAQGAAYDINANANQFLKTLSGAGMLTNSGGSATLFVGGTSASDVTTNVNAIFDGTLAAATTGNLLLNKVGAGRQTLTGVSTYTGATTVSSGTLIVNGSLANTTLTVNGGAALGGTGIIGNALGGTVTVAGGTAAATRGTIDLTTNAAIGTLSLTTLGTNNALTVGGAAAGNPSVFNFDFDSSSTDKIAIQGIARFNVQAGGAIVNLTQVGGSSLAPGVYPLISFVSTNTTNNTLFLAGTVNGGSVGAAQTFSNGWTLSITPSYLRLVVAGSGVEPDLYWKGGFNANWNNPTGGGTTSNWATAAAGTPLSTTLPSATTFVHFAATSPGNLATTTLGQSFTIGQLQFESATTGAIGIALGTNSLTLNGDMVKLNGSGAVTFTGTAPGALVLGGTQAWNNQATLNSDITISAPIISASTNTLLINSSGAGKVIFNGNNIGLTGGVTVAGNGAVTALQLGPLSTNALGPAAGPNPLVVNLGALDMNGQSATVSSLRSDVTTGFIKNTAGALSTLTINQSAATTYSGKLGDTSANNFALVLTGGGSLTLITTANTYVGGTTITDATLRMGNGGNENAASLGTGLVTINAGGLLSFAPGSTTTTFNIPSSFVLNGGGIQSSGGNQRIATSGATIAVSAGGATITPSTTSGQDLYLDGQLTGSGPLNVGNTGSGKVILTNNTNTYDGTLTSTASGNLQLAGGVANSTALAAAAVVNNGAGLTFLTPVTSATFGSLAGSGDFALQNTAAAALSLTVGGNNFDTSYTGIMSNSAAGILGSLTKVGTGTLTLAGLNTYRGATTVSQGTLRVNNASATVSVTGLGTVSVAGSGPGAGQTATLGGNGVIQGGDGTTAGSVTLGSFSFLDPGLAPATFGTLRIGVQSGAATTTLILGSGSTYNFDLGAGAGSQDHLLVVGNVLLTGSILAINSLSTPDQGKYTVLSATNGIGGTTFSSISGVPTGYSVVYTANTVDLQLSATGMVISTPAGLQVITGGTVPFNVFVQNTVASGGANIVFTAASGANTQGAVSPGVTVQPQNTGTGVGLSFNSTAVPIGPGQTGTFTVTDTAGANTPQPGSVNVDVLGHADYGSFAGGTLTLPNVRQGYTGPQTSTNSLTVTNTAGYRVNLKGESLSGPIGNFSLSSFSGVIPGASGGITASLAAGLPASATPYTQDFLYKFGDDSTLVGNNSYLNSQDDITITATVNVYNGQGVWGPVPGGSWGTFGNWTLPGGYPGLDGAASIADTATIGSDLTGVLALDGSSPEINILTFNGSNGTIAQGTGGTLTLRRNPSPLTQAAINVTGGTPTISAPMTFANTVTVATTGVNDQLTISGPIGGPGGLTKVGPGTLTLSGTNSYSGKTAVNGGTLTATSEASFGTAPGPVVADQISINNNAKLAFTGNANLGATQGISVGSGNGTLDVATGQTAIIGGSISGSGTLTKTGGGTLDIRNQNAFVGAFVLTEGTFAVHAASYNPQTTPTLTADVVTGSLTFSGGTLAINVFGTAGAGTNGGHDHLGTSGLDGNSNVLLVPSVTITAPTNLTINLGAFVPTPNVDKFTFISDGSGYSPITNSYFVVNGVTAAPGVTFQVGPYGFQINYADGGGSDITLNSVTPVPEPGSLALLLGGVGLLGLMSRRRQRKAPFAV